MTTVSVPLPDNLLKALDDLIDEGIASNRADGLRKALRRYAEDQAVERVLRAKREPTLEGDLHDLARRLR